MNNIQIGDVVVVEGTGAIGTVVRQTIHGNWVVRLPLTGMEFPWHESDLTVISWMDREGQR